MTDLKRLEALIGSDPQAALRLLEKVNSKVVQPHPAQQQVLNSDSRFRVMNAGRRTGKTVVGAKLLLQKARGDNKMGWWVAPTYKVVKRGYREVLRQLPDGLLTHVPAPDSNFDAGRSVILRFKTGSRIEFYSAERPEGMLGEGVDFAVLDEAAVMPSHVWEQTVSPTLIDRNGEALFLSTPRGRNWFYQNWLRGQDPQEPAWDSWTFPTWTNPYLPPEAIEELRNSLPLLVYEQEVEAKFLAAGSSVFRWSQGGLQPGQVLRSGLVEGGEFRGDHVVLGIDLAKTHDYTVIYGASGRTFRNVYFERMREVSWAEQKRRIRRAVALLMKQGASGVTLCMDSTGVGDPIVEDIESYGYDVVPINFTTHKANMVKLFAKDLEDGRAFLLDQEGINEFEAYQMNTTPAGRITYGAPQGEHDDVVSAKILQHWALVNEGIPDITVIEEAGDTGDFLPREPNPSDERSEEESWDDLLDEEDLVGAPEHDPSGLTLEQYLRPPTVAELMENTDAWTRGY